MARMHVGVHVDGLAQFQRTLKRLDAGLPKALRLALNEATDIVIDEAVPRIPRRTGRAAASVKAMSTRTAARVAAGGPRVRYYGWLDFGGKTGRNRSVDRRFYKHGRYLYRAYFDKRDSGEFAEALGRALGRVAREAGLKVDS
jgi:hypothetical protein